jgi:hypothetical protein
MRRAFAIAAVGIVSLSACAGDDEPTTVDTTSVVDSTTTTAAPDGPPPEEAPPADEGGFCEQIGSLRAYYDTVAPADATTLGFFKENLAILGGVTDVPDGLASDWQSNLDQQAQAIAAMERAGATSMMDAPPEVFDLMTTMGPAGAAISSTVQELCGFTLTFGG